MVSRRNFVLSAAAASAAAALKGAVHAVPEKPLVAVAKGSAAEAVRRAVGKFGGMGKFVKAGDRVVVKPNMGFPNPPSWSTATHPDVVKAVVELCVEAGARRIILMDHPLRDAEICRERTGIGDAVKGLKGVVIAMPSDPKFFKEVPLPKARELKKTAVAKEVLRADCLINVPTAKSHSATGVSLGIKNLMGLVWDRKVFHEQMELNRAIAEQLYVIKPALTVVDALFALTTNGPSGPGKVEKIDKVVAATDPVAADAYTIGLARWYNRTFKGSQVKHVKIAGELGFGQVDTANMEIAEV
jgi:uncharacterized protein (DUF362 family)